jgi:hypothetical protein
MRIILTKFNMVKSICFAGTYGSSSLGAAYGSSYGGGPMKGSSYASRSAGPYGGTNAFATLRSFATYTVAWQLPKMENERIEQWITSVIELA